MVDYLLENYIVWPWDITYESNKNTLVFHWNNDEIRPGWRNGIIIGSRVSILCLGQGRTDQKARGA
jgi:hypothetical protein